MVRERNVVGADVVELAPREDERVSNAVAAELVYEMIGYATCLGQQG